MLRHETGALCWVGLATSDLTRAKAFYERVFGWQSSDLPAGEVGTHTVLRHTGKEVVLPRRTREARAAPDAPHWTPYIAVEDADASAFRARELGGTLLREPHDLLDAGRIVGVRDPTGGVVSLWQGRSRGGAELVDDHGALWPRRTEDEP